MLTNQISLIDKFHTVANKSIFVYIDICLLFLYFNNFLKPLVQSAGAAEYTDCISAEG